jgi:O-succinylbenzoic acid--CoA ligase
VHRLVALDLPGGDAFLSALEACFAAGDAVLPVDQRLPKPAAARLFSELRPSVVIDAAGEHHLEGGRGTDDDDALVMPTSGTSGTPKGVVLTHAALAASAAATSARLGVDPTHDRWLCCLPLSHVGGMSVVTRSLATNTPVELHAGFDVRDVTAAVKGGVTLISLVSTALFRLDRATVDALRVIVLGGSAPPEALPDNVVTTYGLTESGSGVVYDGVPLDGVDVECAADGEILLRGPMVLRAYRDGTDPKDSRGFLPTGDLGAFGDDGRLRVFGRREDVIVSGGEKIWPTPVEQLLLSHPSISEVAIVGVPDPEWHQRAVACVVAAPGATLDLAELRELVRGELGSVHAPRELQLFDELPRTSIGKVRRSELSAAVLARSAT